MCCERECELTLEFASAPDKARWLPGHSEPHPSPKPTHYAAPYGFDKVRLIMLTADN